MVGSKKFIFSFIILNLISYIDFGLAFGFKAEFGVSPDNNQELLFSVIRNAKKSLLINIYEFTNPNVADELTKKIQEGVCTRFLIDGDPVGGITQESLSILEKLITAAGTNSITSAPPSASILGKRPREEFETQSCHQFFILAPQKLLPPVARRRFRFNHAKYVVVDGEISLVSSENFSPNGHPTPGYKGTRGWDIVLHDQKFAGELTALFESDTRPVIQDLRVLDSAMINRLKSKWASAPPPAPAGEEAVIQPQKPDELDNAGETTPRVAPEKASEGPSEPNSEAQPIVLSARSEDDPRRTVPARPTGSGEVNKATLITSPNSAPALRQAIVDTKRSLDLNFMSFPKNTPILGALVAGARRGVVTRVLLNDSKLFAQLGKNKKFEPAKTSAPQAPRPPTAPKIDPQVETAKLLMRFAYCDHLPIDARIINAKPVEITYIHNKGMILDGERVLVSSINGTTNSMENNREVAVLVESPDAARYYGDFFEFDWTRSPALDISKDIERNPCNRFLVNPSASGPAGFFPTVSSSGAGTGPATEEGPNPGT